MAATITAAIATSSSPFANPTYVSDRVEWRKWRLAYAGGRTFKDQYLTRFPARETVADFLVRKARTANPPTTKTEIGKLRNALVQHLAFVKRSGGPQSYLSAIQGLNGGVDRTGRSMHDFFAEEIVLDFIIMSKIGIFVDMAPSIGPTKADNLGIRPYIYAYKREQILNWTPDPQSPGNFRALLLSDCEVDYEENFLLPRQNRQTLYRYFEKVDEREVLYKVYTDPDLKNQANESVILPLSRIPFVEISLPVALMRDVSDMQIALLNMSSSDIEYCYRANFPILAECYDPRRTSPHLDDGEIEDESLAGPTNSIEYPIGTQPPEFISPDVAPLKVSMDKQASLKQDIREAVREAICELDTNQTGTVTGSLPGGLASIGSMFNRAEQQIGEIWSEYEGSSPPPTIVYPKTYSVQSDDERASTCKTLRELIPAVPSRQFKREMSKLLAFTALGGRVNQEVLDTISAEVDSAKYFETDAENLALDIGNGLVSKSWASTNVRGYPEGEAEIAEAEHLKEVQAIAAAQTTGVGPHTSVAGGGGTPTDGMAARGLPSHRGTGSPEKVGRNKRGAGKSSKD